MPRPTSPRISNLLPKTSSAYDARLSGGRPPWRATLNDGGDKGEAVGPDAKAETAGREGASR